MAEFNYSVEKQKTMNKNQIKKAQNILKDAISKTNNPALKKRWQEAIKEFDGVSKKIDSTFDFATAKGIDLKGKTKDTISLVELGVALNKGSGGTFNLDSKLDLQDIDLSQNNNIIEHIKNDPNAGAKISNGLLAFGVAELALSGLGFGGVAGATGAVLPMLGNAITALWGVSPMGVLVVGTALLFKAMPYLKAFKEKYSNKSAKGLTEKLDSLTEEASAESYEEHMFDEFKSTAEVESASYRNECSNVASSLRTSKGIVPDGPGKYKFKDASVLTSAISGNTILKNLVASGKKTEADIGKSILDIYTLSSACRAAAASLYKLHGSSALASDGTIADRTKLAGILSSNPAFATATALGYEDGDVELNIANFVKKEVMASATRDAYVKGIAQKLVDSGNIVKNSSSGKYEFKSGTTISAIVSADPELQDYVLNYGYTEAGIETTIMSEASTIALNRDARVKAACEKAGIDLLKAGKLEPDTAPGTLKFKNPADLTAMIDADPDLKKLRDVTGITEADIGKDILEKSAIEAAYLKVANNLLKSGKISKNHTSGNYEASASLDAEITADPILNSLLTSGTEKSTIESNLIAKATMLGNTFNSAAKTSASTKKITSDRTGVHTMNNADFIATINSNDNLKLLLESGVTDYDIKTMLLRESKLMEDAEIEKLSQEASKCFETKAKDGRFETNAKDPDGLLAILGKVDAIPIILNKSRAKTEIEKNAKKICKKEVEIPNRAKAVVLKVRLSEAIPGSPEETNLRKDIEKLGFQYFDTTLEDAAKSLSSFLGLKKGDDFETAINDIKSSLKDENDPLVAYLESISKEMQHESDSSKTTRDKMKTIAGKLGKEGKDLGFKELG